MPRGPSGLPPDDQQNTDKSLMSEPLTLNLSSKRKRSGDDVRALRVEGVTVSDGGCIKRKGGEDESPCATMECLSTAEHESSSSSMELDLSSKEKEEPSDDSMEEQSLGENGSSKARVRYC